MFTTPIDENISSKASLARKESSEVEQGVLEMNSSLPSPSSSRYSSANEDFSTEIQVEIPPDPSQGHAHTPFMDTSTDASRQDENTGVNENTPPNRGFSKDLYTFALRDRWDKAKSIFAGHPGAVRTPLTTNEDRVLHIAVSADSVSFVKQLVQLVHMTPQVLELKNSEDNTAFCLAAISGNAALLKIMIKRNGKLPLISGQGGMLPVHLAASSGHHEIVRLLSTDDLLLRMEYNDIERLFLMTISSDIFDVALKLFDKKKYRDLLANARADGELTALHILARKPSEFSFSSTGMELFREVRNHVGGLEYNEMLELITKPSTVLFDAIQSGNNGAANLTIGMDPRLLTLLKDSHGRNALHYAALYRRESVLSYILWQRTANHIIRAVDYEGSNVLHLAASYQSREELSRLDTQMQRELAWFQEVKERVPTDLLTMKNSTYQTPTDIFNASHRELGKEVKEIVKGIANSGMLVAALIATVAFAAALTVPGDKTSAWFVVFILTNAAALFASSASIISFLSIFTSAWFIDNAIVTSQTLMKLGLMLLVVSVVSMVLSFAAASFLIFGHVFKWAAYVVVSMGVLPILLLLVLRSKYVDRVHKYFDRLHNYFDCVYNYFC